ncbi:MFS transporter [Streptomyces broussonetiae]|uniref:DHA2 family efflux MFS transporter permease subunit n=1 Tax=Streptomyces broussonetiae TaxID=2686304 RepID=A0A6I6NHA2_9ACTN|nr:MFS transporter [Streptomyces broussonetiae]QHA07357.1 DHA2 family efflux MFS transporter permease subunit [Streptomyces broussonetiae]
MSSTPATTKPPEPSELRRKWPILAICCTSLFIVGLDTTIVNLALPSLQRDLHASASGLQWTVDAYTVVLAGLLLLSGSVADRFGRRRTFQSGLLLFSLASLLCGLAPDTGLLIVFRVLQAMGGAMLNPVAMSIITNTFLDPRQRARAIGIWGGVAGISLALGPVVGGTLVETVGWRSIFWINVPVGLAALLLTVFFVPESRAEHPRRFDPVGQVLVIVVLVALTFGIIEGPARGWGSAPIVGCFAASAAACAALVGYERRRHEPVLDLRFFADVRFSGAIASAVCGFAALAGFLFLNSLFLQDVRGYSPLHAGLLTLPMAAMTLVCGPLAGRIIAARGPRTALIIAGAGTAGCGLLLLDLAADTSVWYLMPAYVLFGAGFGMLDPAITYTAVSGMPRAQAGVASALTSTCRQIGATLGVAVLGSLSTARVRGTFASGFPRASHISWGVMAGCGAAVLVLAVLTSARERPRPAGPVEEEQDAAVRQAPGSGATGPVRRPAP